jgi:general secretion pathway protein G
VQRDAKPAAELAHERLVRVRLLAAEVVIDVRGLDLEAFGAKVGEAEEEGTGVGATGDRGHEPARIQPKFDEELTDGRIDHAQPSAYLRSMARRRESGFTLLEILVVVGIIGIIAAIAVASYFIAIDRARQKRTVNDMRTLAAAWEARATDMHSYASGGYTFPDTPMTSDALVAKLAPTYLREIPMYDGWNRAYDFAVTADAKAYAIRSRGRDGAIDGGTEYTPGETPNPDCDIIYADGGFVTYPSVAQSN